MIEYKDPCSAYYIKAIPEINEGGSRDEGGSRPETN